LNTLKSGKELDITIFQKGANEIYQNIIENRPIKEKILYLSQALLYRHRISKIEGNLPDCLFDEFVKYIKESQWKEILNKKRTHNGNLSLSW